MNRRFYNYTCSIYTFSQQVVRGSSVQSKVILYSNIKCAIWKNTKSYSESQLATQTDLNKYEMNLTASYPVSIGDIVDTSLGIFKVDQVIEHHNSRGKLDNFQVFISSTV